MHHRQESPSRHRRAIIAALAAAAIILTLLAPAAAATDDATEPATTDTQPAHDYVVADGIDDYYGLAPPSETDNTASPEQSSLMGACKHKGRSDNIHISKNEVDVSVHGWWVKTGGTCPPKAYVWVELQAWRCIKIWDPPGDLFDVWDCFWDPIDRSSTKYIYPNGGSANRVNARARCVSDSPVSWRAIVDVDIPFENDSAKKFEGPSTPVGCNPRD